MTGWLLGCLLHILTTTWFYFTLLDLSFHLLIPFFLLVTKVSSKVNCFREEGSTLQVMLYLVAAIFHWGFFMRGATDQSLLGPSFACLIHALSLLLLDILNSTLVLLTVGQNRMTYLLFGPHHLHNSCDMCTSFIFSVLLVILCFGFFGGS